MKASAEAKDGHLPRSAEFYRRVWSLLTPEGYRSLYDNKLLFNRFYASLGLPLARVHGVYDPHVGFTSEGGSLRSAEELRAWLRGFGDRGFAFKPVERMQGHRILVFRGRSPGTTDTFVTLAGEQYNAGQLTELTRKSSLPAGDQAGAKAQPFLLEERIQPHPLLADLLGPTLSTVTVQTIIALDGSPQIIAAVFGLQPGTAARERGDMAVGGWVDLETGKLDPGSTTRERVDTSVIPGTDRRLAGLELPGWAAVKNVALRAAAAFPWARAIGWEIGLSDQGPILLEGNQRWSPSLTQTPAPGSLLTGELKALCENLEAEKRKGARKWIRR